MKKKNIMSLIFTCILLVLVFYKIDIYALCKVLRSFKYSFLIPAAILYVLTLYLRGLRWKFLLPDTQQKVSVLKLAGIFTVGSMLNVFIPARAGDIYRAYHLGKDTSEKKMKIFASVILERIFDGIAVFLLLLTAVLNCYKQKWIINFTFFTGFMFIFAIIAAYLIFRYNKVYPIFERLNKLSDKYLKKGQSVTKKITEHINNFISGFEPLCKIKVTLITFALSLSIWLIECIITYYILCGFGIYIGVWASVFIIALTSFSTVIPSTSVFLGPYQYAYVLALGIFSINKSTALAIATVHQSTLILILVLIGIFYILKNNVSLNLRKTKENSL